MSRTDFYTTPMPLNWVGAGLSMSDFEYALIRDLLQKKAGIALGDHKQALVCGRLFKRLQALELDNYGDYIQLIQRPDQTQEFQTVIDLLTTNETYFYREPQHFETLQAVARQAAGSPAGFKVWSAASSSGEEAYTLAMVLQNLVDNGLGLKWEVVGSDISRRVLAAAARGIYSEDRVQRLPNVLLKRYCLRGTGPGQGTVMVCRELREQVRFEAINLIEPLPRFGPFDAVFLRNVLIYFDLPTKQKVVQSVLGTLKPTGYLYVGLAESLGNVAPRLKAVAPGVYGL